MARTELRFHPIFLFSIVILLVVFSTLGYQVGVSRQSQGFRLLLDASMRQETHNRQRAAACQKKTQELLHTSNSSEAVLRKLIETESKLEAERDALNSEYYLLQEQYNRCDTTREKLKPIAASSGGDNTLKSQVGQLNTHIEHLRATIREFTVSDGMELVLLAESLRSLRGRYLRQCSQTPGCSMLTPAELIARGAAGTELNDSQYTFIVSQDDEADKKRPVRVGSPNEMLNISNLFLLPETVEGSVLDKEPEYFSRQGSHETPPSRSPTSTPISQNQPALDVVEKMTDYSLCAYRANNSNFSFPSCAMSVDLDGSSTAVVHAHEVFRTPMLRFCTDCNATKWTSVYRIACHGHSAVANYGVPDFWSARSMIRVSGEVNSAVRRFYDANNLKGKHVLSVVAPETTQSRQALCNASTSPGPHFLYLKSSYPSDGHITSHVSPSSVQCAPSSSEIAAQIRKVAAQTAYPFAAIYLSAQKDVWNEVAEALKATAEPALSDTIVLDPAKHLHAANSSIGSILDLETASYATDILVSGYLPTGRYVSEVHLLRRHLFPDGHVWFF